jgi:hypothetical protein
VLYVNSSLASSVLSRQYKRSNPPGLFVPWKLVGLQQLFLQSTAISASWRLYTTASAAAAAAAAFFTLQVTVMVPRINGATSTASHPTTVPSSSCKPLQQQQNGN